MPKCKVKECSRQTQFKNTKNLYCIMHLARIRRHGYPELKKDAYRSLEKLPHKFVDNFIKRNYQKMIDTKIVELLRRGGYKGATLWTVKYRRRKLGVKKYLYGEIKKHRAWVREQAIKQYGKACELCAYTLTIDTHHIIPKYKGGQHSINNLMVICPNCHALVTRGLITLNNRKDIPEIKKDILKTLKSAYPNLG